MNSHPPLYLIGGFVLGILSAVCWNEFYYGLKRPGTRRANLKPGGNNQNINDTILFDDNEDDVKDDIREGIEGCIGNTPLINIKSLSAATGCEVLAKAEVTRDLYSLIHTTFVPDIL